MTLLLRTLARKSVIDFGKYKDRTVQQCIDLGNHRMLRWYYYNMSMISYLPDILEEIGVTEEWRIPKPGKDPDKGAALDHEKDIKMVAFRKTAFGHNDHEAMGKVSHDLSRQRRRRKAKYAAFTAKDNKQFSRANMQNYNHGRGGAQ